MKTYQAQTKQFGAREMLMLQNNEADVLIPALMRAGQVIALRAVAEVLLNEDWEKLHAMLSNEAFIGYWRDFESDTGVDDRDRDYAKQLEAVIADMIKK